jgi:sugar lactone lactonase YvrE
MKMKKGASVFGLMLSAAIFAAAQTVETADGVRIVHNQKGGLWKTTPKIKLIPVLKLGDIDTEDEHFVFSRPAAVAVDAAGNIYVLDSQEGRIQKYDKDGKYLATIGRKGQGPGEFGAPSGLFLDGGGNLLISDLMKRQAVLLTAEGRFLKTIDINGPVRPLMKGGFLAGFPGVGVRVTVGVGGPTQENSFPKKLLRLLDASLQTIREFIDPVDKGDDMTNAAYNQFHFAVDGADRVIVAFTRQNRLEKHTLDGRILWRADRELNYKLGPGRTPGGGVRSGSVSVSMPSFVACGNGLAVDGQGRTWVLTYNRQIRDNEMIRISTSQEGTKREGNFDARETDLYKLEIFDPEGVLLGEIPMTTFIDKISIFGDRLFLIDSMRGVCVREFKIEEIG